MVVLEPVAGRTCVTDVPAHNLVHGREAEQDEAHGSGLSHRDSSVHVVLFLPHAAVCSLPSPCHAMHCVSAIIISVLLLLERDE